MKATILSFSAFRLSITLLLLMLSQSEAPAFDGIKHLWSSSTFFPIAANFRPIQNFPPNIKGRVESYTNSLSNGAAVSLGTGCKASSNWEVESFNPMPVSITGFALQDTCGLGLGSVNITVSGGTPPYSFTWSNGAITEDIFNLTAGSYWVFVEDANGDSQFFNIDVNNFTNIWGTNFNYYYTFNFYQNTVCTGPPNGGWDFTQITSYPFSWVWSNGVMTEDNLGLGLGVYNATVTLGTCTAPYTAGGVQNQPDAPVLGPTLTPATCALPNGSIDLTVTESEPPYTYAWSNGASTEDISNLLPGTYAVTVTGSNGCTEEGSYIIEDVPAFTTSGTSSPASSCISANGAIDLTPSPPGGYTFAWSNGAGTEDLSGLSAGTYLVTVTDGNGCTATNSFTVDDTATPPTLSATATPAACGLPSGGVDLAATGGAGPYTFNWSSGATTEDLSNVPGGTYTVTVTGVNGCTATTTATVADNAVAISIGGTATPNTACLSPGGGAPNGGVEATVTPSPPPFGSYVLSWSNGPSTPSQFNLAPGTYTLSVTLGNTCTATASFVVADEPAVATVTATASPATCGQPNGSVALSVGGGAPPYLYQWSDGSTGPGLSGVPAGAYTVTVTGGTGCTTEALAVVGAEPGAADTTAVFGTSCDPGDVGVFEETFTNSNGCDSLVITTISLLQGDTTQVSGTSCNPDDVGVTEQLFTNQQGCDSLVVTTISLLPGDTTQVSGTSCDPDDVGVTEQLFTNGQGCDSLVVTTISLLPGDTTQVSGTSCDPDDVGITEQLFTNSSGCDSLVVTTVTYSASDTTAVFGTSCDPDDVGITEQLFTNSNGCDSLVVTTVTYSASDTTAVFGTSCNPNDVGIFEQLFTNQNGCDSLVVTTIAYSASDTTAVFGTSCNPNDVGVFEQLFTNQNGCDSLVVTTIAYLASDTTAVFGTSCDPGDVGVTEQLFTNGQGCDSLVVTTIVYLASDTTAVFGTSCDPGEVGVTEQLFTNSNGCDSLVVTTVTYSASDTTQVFGTSCNPDEVGITEQLFTNSSGCDSLVVTTIGYSASDTTAVFGTSCDPGEVGVSEQLFTNQNGCDSLVVTTVSLLPSATTSLTATTCDPTLAGVFTENLVTWQGCDSTVTTTVALLPSDTTLIFSTTCDASQAGTTASVYQNQSGCDSVVVATVTWTPPPSLAIAASGFNGFGTSCAGADDGWAQASASGSPPFLFAWQNGETSPLLDALGAGTYAVTATDGNGCTATASATLFEPQPLANSLAINGLGCFDDGSGAVLADGMGGVPPYLYSFNPTGASGSAFQPSGTFGGLSAGAYEVTVLDANGCSATDLVAINAPVPLSVELGDDVFLELGDGTVLTALTNVPPGSLAQVDWSGTGSLECPGCPQQQVFPLVTTAYTVTVVDGQGCSASDGVTVYVDRRKHVYVPNAFSPNGDGINDLLVVFAKQEQVKAVKSFLIFDRWGESVYQYFDFKPNDPATGWDGTHRGQLLDASVFVWFAEVEFVDGSTEVFMGDVVLVR